jgi:hypothetical protein
LLFISFVLRVTFAFVLILTVAFAILTVASCLLPSALLFPVALGCAPLMLPGPWPTQQRGSKGRTSQARGAAQSTGRMSQPSIGLEYCVPFGQHRQQENQMFYTKSKNKKQTKTKNCNTSLQLEGLDIKNTKLIRSKIPLNSC